MNYWTKEEVAVFEKAYFEGGGAGVQKLLPHRNLCSIRSYAKYHGYLISSEYKKSYGMKNLRRGRTNIPLLPRT